VINHNKRQHKKIPKNNAIVRIQ